MALPIKPKDTQEGCNPISSNCVVWQGPDIPCINLCNGDSVSDVVAKLAEELCTIVDQLDISLIDISCFGALAPEPQDFRDVVQLLVDRICNLEAGSSNGIPSTGGCPDNCLVPIAQCLQFTDPLGNVVTEIALRDYLILIGNRVCTILSEINGINGAITNIETRLAVIEQELANPVDNSIVITTAGCVGRGIPTPIAAFVTALETALCDLTNAVGTPTEINIAISQQCTVNGQPLDSAAQLSNSGAAMSNIPGWIQGASYNTLADAVNNLWLTVCDMRVAISDLQTQLAACCSVTCNDVDWNFTATGLVNTKFITLLFTGNIPSGFTYSSGGTTTPVVVNSSTGQSGTYNLDIISAIQTGAPIQLGVDAQGNSLSDSAIWYQVRVPLSVTNGDITCTTEITQTFFNTTFCAIRGFALSVSGLTPVANISVSFNPANVPTQYTMRLYEIVGGTEIQVVPSAVISLPGGGLYTYSFGSSFTEGTYICRVTATQNGGPGSAQYSTDPACVTNTVSVAVAVVPPGL
jgi:hypothetical protein